MKFELPYPENIQEYLLGISKSLQFHYFNPITNGDTKTLSDLGHFLAGYQKYSNKRSEDHCPNSPKKMTSMIQLPGKVMRMT